MTKKLRMSLLNEEPIGTLRDFLLLHRFLVRATPMAELSASEEEIIEQTYQPSKMHSHQFHVTTLVPGARLNWLPGSTFELPGCWQVYRTPQQGLPLWLPSRSYPGLLRPNPRPPSPGLRGGVQYQQLTPFDIQSSRIDYALEILPEIADIPTLRRLYPRHKVKERMPISAEPSTGQHD
ncbi:hypothetical protein CSKR_113715 [Clonorchis sinensis]|uniref:Uncharacterized protein n=1 Tax=Clonorchis sinensis TaxID=79923 RepID=A0A419PCM4_CLOSI|nr:hypothetical protein CSKR_113715 [Clonorchis sinensis]